MGSFILKDFKFCGDRLMEKKAREQFENWITDKTPYFSRYNEIIADQESLSGWLFRFFDEQGIVIEIWYGDGHKGKVYWYGDIDATTVINRANSRTEAEQAAFEKAFEILEKTT